MKKTFLIIACLCITILLQAQISKTVNVIAGGLYSALSINDRNTVTNLTVTGTIDASDFKTMRDSMLVLAMIDLKGTTIISYSGKRGTIVGTSNISYPENTIPETAFYKTDVKIAKLSLASFVFPLSITSIGNSAFFGCLKLKSVAIPSLVTSIGDYAFSIGDNSNLFGSGLTSISIPSSVTSIGEYTFSGCGLTSVTIPSSVKSIGVGAFKNCQQLISIAMSSSVSLIQSFTFYDCHSLTSITIPSSVTSIGDYAFSYCEGLTSISFTIPSLVTSIGGGVFNNCIRLTSISIPSSVTSIGGGAFNYCKGLTSISIPASVTSIGTSAFNSSGLTSISIPSSVTAIGTRTFSKCEKLTSITIPQSVTSIGDYAFSDSGLTSVSIPSSVKSIGVGAFKNCQQLTSISIPSSVTSIGDYTFSGCVGLISIYAYSVIPIVLNSSSVFLQVNPFTCILNVPIGTKNTYKITNVWKNFNYIVEFAPTNVEQFKTDKISIYPNPATEGFRVNGINGMSSLRLSDINGKLLFKKEIDNNEYVSLSSLPIGIYFVNVGSGDKTIAKKLVKE